MIDMLSQVFMIMLCSNCFYIPQCNAVKQYFKEGSIAVLQCPYKSYDFPLVWMKGKQLKVISSNNFIVEKHQQHKVTVIGNYSIGEYNLAIHNFSSNDQALYRCQGISEQTAFAEDILVVLAIQPSNIKIANKTKRNTIELFEERSSEITCFVSNGIPSAQLVLNIDGKAVKKGRSDFISIQIKGNKRLHMKPITCTANQLFLEKPLEDTAVLFVFMAPTIRIAAKPSTDILEGNRITLECIDGSNVLSKNYSWEVDGILLTNVTSNILEIIHIAKHDSGIYACHVQNLIGSSRSTTTVNVYHRPYLHENSSFILNYTTEVGGRALVSILIESNPEPITVSCVNITDLKIDEWTTERQVYGNNIFLLKTTVFPIHTEQYGAYMILVRNQYGRLKVAINLKLPDVKVTVFPDYPMCDVSENLTLLCILHQKNFHMWKNSWSHWINGTFIRNISGIMKGNASFIYFPFCDYQDFGTYECSWVLQNRHGISSVFVSVNSVPVKTDYRMSISNTNILLGVDIFSREPIRSTDWFENGLKISNVTEKYDLFTRKTDILLSVYKQQLPISGFEIGLKIRNTHFSKNAVYICQITNAFGSTEMYFEADQFIQNTIQYTVSTTLAEDLSTGLEESADGSIFNIVKQNIHFVISGFVLICAMFMISAIIWRIKKGHKKCTLRKINQSITSGQQIPRDETNESEYAEIESNDYHSVEWRVYPSTIDISSLRRNTDDESSSARNKNAFEDLTNVYLDVIDDSESLKDVHTAIIHDNTNGESSSTNTSGTSSSSYIRPIMRNSLNDSRDQILAFENASVAETNNDDSVNNVISHGNSSGFSLSYLNSKSSEQDDCEGNIFAENNELCENKPVRERIGDILNYEKLNIDQTETHLYDQ